MTKTELAQELARREPSVAMGLQTYDQWVRYNLRESKATLVARFERAEAAR